MSAVTDVAAPRGRRWLAGSLAAVRSSARVRTFCGLFLALLVFSAIFASFVAPYGPNAQSIADRLTPPAWLEGGSTAHLLGTDALGRDVLSRIIHGARTSVVIGVITVAIAATFGILLGTLAGYVRGKFDAIVMRIVDIMFSFPGLLIAMIMVLTLGASARTIIIALSIDGWMVYTRLARSMVLSVRNTAYVEAAKVIGCSNARLIARHVLPNVLSPLVTLATLEFARIVLAESVLSFLGLGIQPPLVSWGLMLKEGEDYLTIAWWLVTFPGLVLALTVLSANVIASWLRVAADPLQRVGAR